MNNFKSIRVISEADADEYILDDDDSEDELAPRADGEAEFVDLHTAVSIAHPVAGDNQFKSDKDQAVTKNAESDNAEGEDKPVKQGTSGDTKFAQFRDKIGKTPARKGDKSQGDMKAGSVKEEVELDEADATVKQQKSLKALMTKALGGKRSKPGYKSFIGNNGDFVVADGGGRVVGRIKSGDYKDPMKEEVELDEAQKLFMFKTKPEADKKAKEIKGKVISLGPKNFAVVTMDLTVVKEEVELDEAVKAGMMKLKDGKSIKVSPDEAKMFNDVLKELNPENRKRMEMEMMKDQKSYKSMLTFAKRTA